jgi:hypothetical protein
MKFAGGNASVNFFWEFATDRNVFCYDLRRGSTTPMPSIVVVAEAGDCLFVGTVELRDWSITPKA